MFKLKCSCNASAKEENKDGRHHIKGTNVEFKVMYAIKEVDAQLSEPDTIFLQSKYLHLLEHHPSKENQSVYITVYESGTFRGIIYAQLAHLNLAESLNWDKNTRTFKEKARSKVTKQLARKWLIVGNLLLTGNFGIRLHNKSTREAFVVADLVVKNALPVIEKDTGSKISFLLYKDFSEDEAAQSEVLQERHFTCFNSEPSMIMDIPKDWESFDDYMNAISSKYKKRARRAFKKVNELQRKSLSVEEITFYQDRIHSLYQQVAHAVDLNMVHLNRNYFLELKKQFGENFQLYAYFLQGEIIGFCTAIKDYDETHAHFLGLDNQYNKEYQLYLNMLYDLIKIAIDNGSSRINFARTAPEIKSSVGAYPKEVFLFVKHRKPLVNRFIPTMMNYMQPQTEVIYRSPFKENQEKKKSKKSKAVAVSDSEVQKVR